jgi:putative PIN family toxin of toxin-antitoxin system
MIVVIDTNVVMTMFKKTHSNRPIFDAWAAGRLLWAVSTEILLEYEEVISRMSVPDYAALVLHTVETIDELRQNMLRITPTFHFRQIIKDPDDDKFVDCAIAAEADNIITSDHHFDALIGSGYKPQPITPEEFITRCL